MAKKEKTRKQKIASDQRKHAENNRMPSISAEQVPDNTPLFVNTPVAVPPKQSIAVNDYQYLSKDLLKTAILTGSIIVTELVIKHFVM